MIGLAIRSLINLSKANTQHTLPHVATVHKSLLSEVNFNTKQRIVTHHKKCTVVLNVQLCIIYTDYYTRF